MAPVAPALALRATEEGKAPAALAAQLTGLEEPTLADVQQALVALDGLQWAGEAAPKHADAIICAGDAEATSAVVERMLAEFDGPRPVAYAVVTSPAHAERLIAAGLLQTRIMGVAYGVDQQPLVDGYRRLGVSVYSFTTATAEQALAEALATQFARGAVVNGLRVAHVLTDPEVARAYLEILGGRLQFADGSHPGRLTAAITHALDVLSAYL